METITTTVDDLRAVVSAIMADAKIEKLLKNPQLILSEAQAIYGENRINEYIKRGMLKPVSQNGKGAKKYYSHKRIIYLTTQSFHNFKSSKS